MAQVLERGTALIDDPARLDPSDAPVTAIGVNETAFLRATVASDAVRHRHRRPDPGRPARLLDVVEAAPARCWPGGWPTGIPRGGRR
jgi:hypothetical protein